MHEPMGEQMHDKTVDKNSELDDNILSDIGWCGPGPTYQADQGTG